MSRRWVEGSGQFRSEGRERAGLTPGGESVRSDGLWVRVGERSLLDPRVRGLVK